jgi:hypothetical protein
MSECCGGSAPSAEYTYGPQPFEDGTVDTAAGPVARLATTLSTADHLGTLKMRLGAGRSDYRVKPALYAIGVPDDTSPVLVTGNYKLTVDVVRRDLAGHDVWLLVIDSRGVNVWCAAGKGVFSTAEVARMVKVSGLEQVVSHKRLVLPQLGATGVAGHIVRAFTGFSVVWGPVRSADLPAFLAAGMKATPEMRRVTFPLVERVKLAGVELSMLWSRTGLIVLGVAALLAIVFALVAPALIGVIGAAVAVGVAAVVAGAAVMPALLPYLPGRTFSLKGAVAGSIVITIVLMAILGGQPAPLWAWGLFLIGIALSSFVAMNFTGSSTFTSPSGVEWEMRRAVPAQLAASAVGVVLAIVGVILAGGPR